MPNYIQDALKRFKQEKHKIWKGSLHKHTVPNYGAKQQFEEAEPNDLVLGKETLKKNQQVLGTFLYYARAVDTTMIVALSAISSEQASPTQSTMTKVDQFFDYAASQEQDVLTYEASDMVLSVQSNASHLSESKARSQASGHFLCTRMSSPPPTMELCST